MATLILLRHGQSEWNQKNLFTGWHDIGLTERGVSEAIEAGRAMKAAGYLPDIAFTSFQKRAIKTLWLGLEELDRTWIPVHRSWRLNERHYGGLQGLNKAETVAKHGEDQVKIWRRSYDTPPPPLALDDERHPGNDPRYAAIPRQDLPTSESLKDTLTRALPYWFDAIVPALRAGQVVLVAAHGNSLRALVKHLDQVPEDVITGLNIPTGFPLVYDLDEDLRPTKKGGTYLGDEEKLAAAVHEVANQTKKK